MDLNNMPPKLYIDNRSPPVRSVLMLIDELRLNVDFVEIDLFKRDHLSAEFLEISPQHTVPAFKDNDIILNDSHSILMYMVDKYKNNKLNENWFPKSDQLTRYRIIDRLMFNATILFRRDSEVFTEIFASQPTDISKHLTKLSDAYDSLESYLKKSKYIAGDNLTIADLSVVATLSTVNLILPVKPDKWPHLAIWFREMSSRDSYDKWNLPGLTKLRDTLKPIAKCEIVNEDMKVF